MTPRRQLLPRVYPIVDTVALEARGIEAGVFAQALLDGGAGLLQFRHKGSYTRADFFTAARIAAACRDTAAQFVVNDRADVALALNAGVHVGQDDVLPGDARTVVGNERLLGFSTHNEAQLRAGDSEPVDYLALGPIFGTKSKARPDPVVGVDGLARLRRLTAKPLVAVGGITLDNARHVLEAGADCVAVIGALIPESPNPVLVRQRMEEWLKATK